jgi:inner membrane protein
MYADGHWGINLILFSPVAFALTALNMYTLLVFTIMCVLFIARRPDDDMKLQRITSRLRSFPGLSYIVPQITHRGITHTVWYATVWGILVGTVTALFSVYGPMQVVFTPESMQLGIFGFYGFFLGFLGIVGHLLGDVITPSGIKPFYPIRETKYTLSLVYAKNKPANVLLFLVGAILWGVAIYTGLAYY